MLYPKLFTTLKNYTRAQFLSDFSAGVIVGIVALPLAIAFAIASGVSPDRGLVTAVVAGFIISLLGGSRVQIGGPTGAFIVIVYAIVQKHGVNGLVVSMLMAGVMMIGMGVARLGSIIKFIPYPVTIGFTSGIALIIFSSQMRDLLGLSTGTLPAEFIEKWVIYFRSMESLNPYAVILGLGTIALIQFWRRVTAKIPGPLIALVLSSVIVHLFQWPVETIASRFGEIPHALPMPVMPHLSLELIRELTSPAITIALLASIESLLSAVVADGMIGGKHRSNMELVAQGVANIASALFGGMPATGAIARTTTNVHNGGRTPVAGIIHALTLFLIMIFFGKWAGLVPLSCLAGILIVVAYHMCEWRSFLMVLRSPRSDVVVLLITFFLTVLIDLTVAIEVGMVLAAFLFMRKMALTSHTDMLTEELRDQPDGEDDPQAIQKKQVPKGVIVYEVNGPFFFGASANFIETMSVVTREKPKVIIVRMRHVPLIDATGLHVIETEYKNAKRKGVVLLLSGIQPGLFELLDTAGLVTLIGPENVFNHIDKALERARELVDFPRR